MGLDDTLAAAGELQDSDIAVYAWVLGHGSASVDAIAARTGADAGEGAAAVKRLLKLRLLQQHPDEPATVFAVAPETAAAQLAAPVEAEILHQRQRLSGIRRELLRAAPTYDNRRSAVGAVEVLENLHLVREALAQASERCCEEIIASQPGGGARVSEAMEEALVRDRAVLERGVRLRTLYHHTARFNGPSQAYVAAASALGGEYRTAHELFGRLIVFDRETAFIPVQGDSWGAVVIREPSTIAYLCEIFEQTWDRATPFTAAVGQQLETVSREIHETIVRLLAAGLKDEAIARRLGMSLRTARRHIADIMGDLGAESRFQAGVRAAAQGLLDADEPDATLVAPSARPGVGPVPTPPPSGAPERPHGNNSS
ncbi:helix-turn-helix transcriptional regulator [Streptomyces sp. HSG2]|uniref:helix-turn-helix transcriptional regulator n=1 Tax=Streptomyces sp. HSG2 TaxID=2797167 RepID=UPI001904F435|nr:helix-turn-helix transcriptional regulator [Streptomyces sp. HSG2]